MLAKERVVYGPDPSQYAELSRPVGRSRGVVVVIHGGFWKDRYDLALARPLAESLVAHGWTAWNLEYRRVGPVRESGSGGGGVPATLDDVAAGIDALAAVPQLDLSRVVAVGHSAGGHLAAWAAARARFARWADAAVTVTQVISQSGVLDLGAAYRAGLGSDAVAGFVGHPPDGTYDEIDPTRQIPLDVPIWCVHGTGDQTVPFDQSAGYVALARDAGASATLVPFAGDHFEVIDPAEHAWRLVLGILDSIAQPH
ncbi:MAG: alpha/beta hydrolase family protein [Nocardioides sp.]